ncbi:MAG: pyrroloquinoline quinone-dependent dehydrogenase [Pseudohongiellaceae bacterium]
MLSSTVSNRLATYCLSAFAVGYGVMHEISAAEMPAGNDTDTGAWPGYGGDLYSRKYSPLSQITRDNVSELEIAWSWDSPDAELIAAADGQSPGAYKSTPLMINDVLYISTSMGQVAAINAVSGESIWTFDTGSSVNGRPTNLGFNHRGVGYWSDGDRERIFMPSHDFYLWSLDAGTGAPDPNFGDGGRIDLKVGLERDFDRDRVSNISAPLIVNDVVVVGSSISDGPRFQEAPPGHVRAYDTRTGEQRWIFHTIPRQGQFGIETWGDNSWQDTGNTNMWTQASADPDLGYVYLPLSTPTSDYYGGHRPGDNLFAESLVAVDAATGERVWHFQAVHHGLWDYDFPAAPNLLDIVVDGRAIKAVAQISKQGFVYVLDRETGEPVWPIVETPFPPSTVPGEITSPTQPIPTRPAPFEYQGISEETLINFTPELHAEALEIISRFDYGFYVPPSVRGTINLPGSGGGAEWTGAAVDPATGIIYIPSHSGTVVIALEEPSQPADLDYVRSRRVRAVRGPEGLPITKPPYGRITAIDLNTGEHLWQVPHGDGIRQRLIDMGIPDPGPVGNAGVNGPVLTANLLFVGRRADDGTGALTAYDKATGDVVHETHLPLAPRGTPMTYMSGGRQYIAIAVGGGPDSRLVALALP